MRHRHIIAIFGIIALAHSATAADRCTQIADVVKRAAAMKPKLLEQLKKNPQKDTLGDPWRWLALAFGGDLEELHVPQDEQQYIFKTVANLNFSRKPLVDFVIFHEYFYLRCKRKERRLPTPPLGSLPAASLTHCMDIAKTEVQFQECMEKLFEKH
jgi:hypothetical protein